MCQLTFKLTNVKKKCCLVTLVFVQVLHLFLNIKMQKKKKKPPTFQLL